MKIQLVSYVSDLPASRRVEITAEIFNSSRADLLLFSGYTIDTTNDLVILRSKLTNKKSKAVFELSVLRSEMVEKCLYMIKNGKIINLYTNQLFCYSSDIENNTELADRLLFEFETRRQLKINGYSILLFQCGEINILRNVQSDGNRVEFRLPHNIEIVNRFLEMISNTDIILNPIHTPMGNQGKMSKRREFLSGGGKSYFSACNTHENSSNLHLKSLQYAYYDGKEIQEKYLFCEKEYIYRVYEI